VIEASELAELESSLLPALERHHLRLLAHGLRTFQAVAGRRQGPLPATDALAAWASGQPQLVGDPGFAATFLQQLAGLGDELQLIGARRGCDPLALELADLISWAEHQAQERLELPSFTADPSAPPPG
jgi:hypothetical protein